MIAIVLLTFANTVSADTNVAYGKTVSVVGSSVGGTFSADPSENIVDGNFSTSAPVSSWAQSYFSQDDTTYLQIDLGEIYNLSSVNFKAVFICDVDYAYLTLKVSNNGVTWNTLYLQSSCDASVNNTYTSNISSVRYIRSTLYSPYGDAYGKWYEIQALINVSNSTITALTPANSSSSVSVPVTFTWKEWPKDLPHTIYIATDSQFLNIVYTATVTPGINDMFTTSVSGLSEGVQYWWKVKNNSGSYTNTMTFTTGYMPPTPGRFNITVFDERNWTTCISTFSAQIYNTTTMINKNTTTGWINLSSAEIGSGQYFIQIIPNSSYASRSILATSPGNVSIWIPATTNTIDTINFYLLDYTNRFPWDISYLVMTKNNSVMHSSYFDADAKVGIYLIRGDSYTISVYNGDQMQQWGNYISTASGNVEVVIINVGANTTALNPFVYNLTWSNSDITMGWNDEGSVMSSINYSIYKGVGKSLVHSLVTSVSYGSSSYTVTNTSDIYYVYVSASTTSGWKNQTQVIDYRSGMSASEAESPKLYTWSYGSATVPHWIMNIFAIVALMILAGSFGALHRGEGAIFTGFMALLFWKLTWLDLGGVAVGFLGGLVLFAVLYAMEGKRRGTGFY